MVAIKARPQRITGYATGNAGGRRPSGRGSRSTKGIGRRAAWFFLFVALAFGIVYRSAEMAEQMQQIILLKDELQNIEADNGRLEMKILRLSSLARIEQEATTRLGMVRSEEPRQVHSFAFDGPVEGSLAQIRTETDPVRVAAGQGPNGLTPGMGLNADTAAMMDRLAARFFRWLTGG